MHRTQPVVSKNKKKSTTANKPKGGKIKGTKCENTDQIKSKMNSSENGKCSVKLPSIKVQGQNHTDNVSHQENSNQIVNVTERKLERSNSFFLTRKLSKIYDSLTNSKECLKDNNDDNSSNKHDTKTPFKFIRSVSLAAISLKKDYRNSMRKPKLEQLSEEDHPFGVPIKEKSKKDKKKLKTASMDSLTSRTSEKSSMIASFKRTFSLTPSRRKTTNSRWSASLMSLQQIDVMISYEDLSFIDYDKFNTYEKNLMNKIASTNQIDVNRACIEQFPAVKMRQRSNNVTQQHHLQQQHLQRRRHSTVYQQSTQIDGEDTCDWINATSKRWSNPCFSANTNEYVVSLPSNVAIGKVQPPSTFGCVDECDFIANNKRSIDNNNTNFTKVAHSVDDLTGKLNEKTDLLQQQTVSSSIFV